MDVVINLIISLFCCYCMNIYCFHLQLNGVMSLKSWKCIDILAKINLC